VCGKRYPDSEKLDGSWYHIGTVPVIRYRTINLTTGADFRIYASNLDSDKQLSQGAELTENWYNTVRYLKLCLYRTVPKGVVEIRM
jgi:hypothetical protein